MSDNKNVLSKINKAKEKNLTALDLNNNQLTTLSTEISQLTNLTTLYLSSNLLTTLPTEIFQLTNLTRLYLNGNQLTTLPAEIFQLTNLTTLYLSSNLLTTLPTEIFRLTNLTALYLSSNPIRRTLKDLGINGTRQVLEYYHRCHQYNFFLVYSVLGLDCSYPVVNAFSVSWKTH